MIGYHVSINLNIRINIYLNSLLKNSLRLIKSEENAIDSPSNEARGLRAIVRKKHALMHTKYRKFSVIDGFFFFTSEWKI